MIHAKVLCIDGLWAVVGSTNFDSRSFSLNDEVNVAIPDRQVVQRLEQDFQTDLHYSRQISYDEWKRRPIWERLQERIDDPTKRWKFQHGDIDERKLWSEYRTAYEDALTKTSTSWAPWWIIPANTKWYRNYLVGKILVDTLGKLDMQYPQPDLSNEVIE